MNIDRESLLAVLRLATDPRGLRPSELATRLEADTKGRHRIPRLLSTLVDEGALEKSEGSRYRPIGWLPDPSPQTAPALAKPARGRRSPPASQQTPTPADATEVGPSGSIAGRICVHPAGYGFVTRDDGEEDVFISARARGPALDGDRVAVAIWQGFKGTEGRVVSVLQHGRAKITGVVRKNGSEVYLEADDPRILGHVRLDLTASRDDATAGVHEGLAVVAEILVYPEAPDAQLTARVLHILGDPDDPRTEVAKVIACADIPDQFPADVQTDGERSPETVSLADMIDRVDLRDRAFLTIDPDTARDFDDAVCVENGPRPGLERLWVAVADVSHYVRPRTPIDREARVRGVSVYLPDRAIPMLPHQLSSGICSLNPEVDRLAMVARLDIDPSGLVIHAHFAAAVIRSRARLDYAGVAAALHGDLRGPRARYEQYLPQLRRLAQVAARLRLLRNARGSLDFDLPEAVVQLDQDDPRRVRDVKRSRAQPEVREAYRLVEDCMLAANEAVARFFKSRELDTLWRVHAPPKETRLAEFAQLAESFGIHFDAEKMRTPRQLREFLAQLEGTPMERSLSYLLLRAMKQATYQVSNIGHFGLAAPEYLHFTSPIRRYPDLIVHRLMKRQLHLEGLPAGGNWHDPAPPREELQHDAETCSTFERRAMEAEREVVDMYRAFLMRDRVGDEFDGTIAGVTGFGIFIEIAEPFVEGLIKSEKLGRETFILDERTVRLVGSRSGHAFALGDKVRVRIENVSVPRRRIDLALVDHTETAARELPTAPPPKRRPSPTTTRRRR